MSGSVVGEAAEASQLGNASCWRGLGILKKQSRGLVITEIFDGIWVKVD